MYRAFGAGLADAPNDQRLDVATFDLYENGGAISDGMQDFRERRNKNTFRQWKASDLVDRQIGDSRSSAVAQVAGLNYRIVVYYDGAVTRSMYVQLDPFGTKLDRAKKCGNRILGKRVVGTPVGDGGRVGGRCSQAWPLVS